MNDLTFIEHLAAASASEVFARTACGFAALQLYGSIKVAGFDPVVHSAPVETLANDVERLGPVSRVRTSLSAVAQALPFWNRSDLYSAPSDGIARRAVYTAFIQYGQALASEAEWRLADTVYAIIAVDAELDAEVVVAAEARFLSGLACRMCADWEGSEAAYQRAYELASSAGEMSLALRIQIGQANSLWIRGNLPEAEGRLEAVARRARAVCPEVFARAILARAGVAHAAGQYETAVVLAHRALESTDEDIVRYQALTDIASFSVDCGLPSMAIEALDIVASTAPDRGVRSNALLNRLFLAVTAGDRDTFDALRGYLDAALLTPRQQVQYALARSQGYRKFGQLALARAALGQATTIADDAKLFQLSFEAEEEEKQLAIAMSTTKAECTSGSSGLAPDHAQTQPLPSTLVSTTPARIRRVQRSIHEMAIMAEALW